MKKVTLTLLLLGAFIAKAQEVQKDSTITNLKETVDAHSMKFEGLEERLNASDAILNALNKISVSGYIQAQYDMYDTWNKAGTVHGTGSPVVSNSFYLRRARIKFAYKATEGVKFVLQPDFAFDKVSLKDAYVMLNDRWTNTYSLYVGQFDRPNYEIEYSSGSMEMLERSKMAGTLYPGEKELGAKLEANFDSKYNLPLKLQLAVLNGNFNLGTTSNQTKDVDNNKDVMARAVYSIKLPTKGLGIDFGGHGYFGSTKVINAEIFSDVNNVSSLQAAGTTLKKQWFGAEMQVYYDFLGGMSFKTEYIAGTNSGSKGATGVNDVIKNSAFSNGSAVRDFSGYYALLIKNVGVKNQLVARYDVFDPNTKLSGDSVDNVGDLKYSTLSLSWQYFFDDNIKINFGYTIPTNEKSSNVALASTDFSNRDKKDNTFTIRLQAKF